MVTQHDDHGGDAGQQELDEVLEKGRTGIGQQSLICAHAARRTGGQDDAGQGHFRIPAANTDFERGFQPAWALRRMPIISATTATAISSGVMAPTSSPIGEWTRSKRSRGMPSFSSSLMTLIALRLLPIMPM